jgi:ABC-type nitrate/sulfonate/bicarbonate transport system permease component
MTLMKSFRDERTTTAVLGVVGIIIMLAIWEVAGRAGWLGRGWPPFTAVFDSFIDNRSIFWRAIPATLNEAAKGFVAGILIGLFMAMMGLLAPPLNRGIGRMATLVNSIPWIALGPLIVMVVSQAAVPFTFALLAVFFASFVAISSGFQLASQAHHDALSVMGSSKWVRFRRVQLPVAVPSLVYAAKLGAPAAMFGVIFGEWFGSSRPGLGALIVTSLQTLQTDRLWAAATVTALIALLAYGLLAVAEKAALARFR